jgi:hypothetical protein
MTNFASKISLLNTNGILKNQLTTITNATKMRANLKFFNDKKFG